MLRRVATCHLNRRSFSTASTATRSLTNFDRDGVVIFDFDPNQTSGFLDTANQEVNTHFQEAFTRARKHFNLHNNEELPPGMDHGFEEMVQRAKGRFDMLYNVNGREPFVKNFGPNFDNKLLPANEAFATAVHPFVQQVLGPDYRLEFNGCLLSQPGAAHQGWHVDGQHLFQQEFLSGKGPDILPCHCLNIFIPLVNLEMVPQDPSDPTSGLVSNGGTQFAKGSQRYTQYFDSSIVWQDDTWLQKITDLGYGSVEGEELFDISVQRGELLAFDYRTLHKARAHGGSLERPLLYYTYVRPWFSDSLNFSGLPSLRNVGAKSSLGAHMGC